MRDIQLFTDPALPGVESGKHKPFSSSSVLAGPDDFFDPKLESRFARPGDDLARVGRGKSGSRIMLDITSWSFLNIGLNISRPEVQSRGKSFRVIKCVQSGISFDDHR
ncbi:hypothetical protein RRG08_059509, partial [Elysia crispata]